jgi:hypothetical protein
VTPTPRSVLLRYLGPLRVEISPEEPGPDLAWCRIYRGRVWFASSISSMTRLGAWCAAWEKYNDTRWAIDVLETLIRALAKPSSYRGHPGGLRAAGSWSQDSLVQHVRRVHSDCQRSATLVPYYAVEGVVEWALTALADVGFVYKEPGARTGGSAPYVLQGHLPARAQSPAVAAPGPLCEPVRHRSGEQPDHLERRHRDHERQGHAVGQRDDRGQHHPLPRRHRHPGRLGVRAPDADDLRRPRPVRRRSDRQPFVQRHHPELSPS